MSYPLHTRQPFGLAALAVLASVALAACGATAPQGRTSLDTPASSAPAKASGDGPVAFEVVGEDGATSVSTLTYTVQVTIKQESGVPLPYTKEITGGGYPLHLTAQNAGTSGSITCRIKAGGKVVREARGEGPYGVCNVRAEAP